MQHNGRAATCRGTHSEWETSPIGIGEEVVVLRSYVCGALTFEQHWPSAVGGRRDVGEWPSSAPQHHHRHDCGVCALLGNSAFTRSGRDRDDLVAMKGEKSAARCAVSMVTDCSGFDGG